MGLALLWVGPYDWPTGSHAQEVLPILARLEGVFARDFAVQSFLGPTPRWLYQELIVLLARTRLGVSGAYLLLQIAALTASAAAVTRFVQHVFRAHDSRWNVGLAAALTFWLAAANTRGWNVPIVPSANAIPSGFAMPFVLWGFYHAARARGGVAFALMGIAALLQVLVGLIGGGMLIGISIFERRSTRASGRALAGISFWAACIAAVALPTIVVGGTAASGSEIVRIFGRVRAPDHWMPSEGGLSYWSNQLAFFAAGAMLLWHGSPALPVHVRRAGCALVCLAAIGVAANYGLVELAGSAWVGKLQLQRTIPFAYIAILVGLTSFAHEAVTRRRWPAVVAVALAPLSGMHGVTTALLALSAIRDKAGAHDTKLFALIAVTGLAPAPYNFAGSPRSLLFVIAVVGMVVVAEVAPRAARRVFTTVISVAIVAATVIALTVSGRRLEGPIAGRLQRNAPSISRASLIPAEMRELADLVKANVPTGELVMAPPLPSLEYLALLSRRSLALSWVNVPYTDAGIIEWGRRFDHMLGQRHQGRITEAGIVREWKGQPDTALRSIAGAIQAEYVLTRDEWHGSALGIRVASTGGWTIWRLY
jgi:hypothetical protein